MKAGVGTGYTRDDERARILEERLERLERLLTEKEGKLLEPFEAGDQNEKAREEMEARRAWGRHDALREYMKVFNGEVPHRRP